MAREMGAAAQFFRAPIRTFAREGSMLRLDFRFRRTFKSRLVVARSSLFIEYRKSKFFKRPKVVRFATGCEDFLPLQGNARNTKGLRVIANKKSPLGVRFKFGAGKFGKRNFEMTDGNQSICFIANAMCRAACYQPSRCDEYLDPDGIIDLKGVAAKQHKANLLPLCAPVSGLARAAGVSQKISDGEDKFGPSALRPFVWHHLFKAGLGEPLPRTEAMAYAAAACDKHALPFWSCGDEECSLCQGVASIYASSQDPDQWCTSFHWWNFQNLSYASYARDLGRYHKCNYLVGYLASTEDKKRLKGRQSTTEEACSARDFCDAKTNKLPKLDMRPGLEEYTEAHQDSECRLCVEFAQRAAGGLRPKKFCSAIPNMYRQQQAMLSVGCFRSTQVSPVVMFGVC